MKEEQSSAMIMKEREEGKLENHRSLVEMTQRYENQISDLKKEVKRFDNIFIEKEKQKKTLLLEMEEMSSNHQIELSEARNSIIKN